MVRVVPISSLEKMSVSQLATRGKILFEEHLAISKTRDQKFSVKQRVDRVRRLNKISAEHKKVTNALKKKNRSCK